MRLERPLASLAVIALGVSILLVAWSVGLAG
jgi:hypothetical protein